MSNSLEYGDYLTVDGKSFRYIESYQGDEWPHSRVIAEAVDTDIDPFAEDAKWQQLYPGSNYFILWLDECEIVKASDPQTFQADGI